MPKKKKSITRSKKVSQSPSRKSPVQGFSFSKVSLDESYVSLFLGVIVVVVIAVAAFFIINGKRLQSQNSNADKVRSQLQQELDEQMKTKSGLITGSSYTVVPGDDLWTIAVKRYGDGYKWSDISRINKIANPNILFAGTKLSLPDNMASVKKTYVVEEGDSLWNIAVSAYGDGYRFVEIAKLNNLSNPNWIYTGEVILLP